MTQPRYEFTGPGHTIHCLSRSGDRVLLDDRSVWTLDPTELPRVRRWSRWAPISVVEARFGGYWLIAQRDGHEERVLVGFAGTLSDRPVPVALAS